MTKPKKPDISPEETALFRRMMKGVKPLVHTKIAPEGVKIKKSPPIHQTRIAVDQEPEPLVYFSDHERLPPAGSEERIEFFSPGLQPKAVRRMRQGDYPLHAKLDLHGKTISEARESLARFLLQCQQNDRQHVLIIHGKGRENAMPVLKNKLNNWLRQTEQVVGFCTAQPKHGGSGALYVWLRRS